ncbi:MAG TPA: hypothetical protein VNA14_06640 [Mycobacteriales bacterium]|nr:hypothetical protein [Mycobacteriales bacterium]
MSASAPETRKRLWRRRVLRGLGAGVAALFLVIVTQGFLPGVATGPALVTSVQRVYNSTFTGCTAEVEGLRTCAVTGSEGSGSDHVDVRLRGRCWTAERVFIGGSQPPAAERGEGCIRLADNLRLFERVMGGDPVDDIPWLLRNP